MIETSGSIRTTELPVAERIGMWEDYHATNLIGLRCRTLDSADFDASEVQRGIGRVQLARVSGTPHVVERTAADIRRHPTEAIAAYTLLSGEGFFHHEHGTVMLRPGQVLLCDADRPFLRGFNHRLDELVTRIPRAAIAEIVGTAVADVDAPQIVGLGSASGAHVRALVDVAGRATGALPPLPELDARPADDATIVELVSTMLSHRRDLDTPSSHLAAARAYIERHLTEPDLGAGRIAAGIGLSERQLSRVFAGADSSLPGYVLGRRLERAHRILADGNSPNVPIREVAARCGISSASYFSKSFTARFGATPAEMRRSARATN